MADPTGGLRFAPMMATPAPLPAEQQDWAFEVKWDGVRALAYVAAGALRLDSRKGADISRRYPELQQLPSGLASLAAVIDGEIVAFDSAGRPSFEQLQHRMHVANAVEVRRRAERHPVCFMAFDLLWLEGRDTTALAYTERRRLLEHMDVAGGRWQMPAHHVGDGDALLAATRSQGLEGVIAKRLDSSYEPGRRTRSWLKVKNTRRQEAVIGGWLPGRGQRQGRLGALLLGHHDAGGLRYCGKVGTGYTERVLDELAAVLAPLEQAQPPFTNPEAVPGRRDARWVAPALVCEVEFTEWTDDGMLRHPTFRGLRDDKDPHEVVRDAADA